MRRAAVAVLVAVLVLAGVAPTHAQEAQPTPQGESVGTPGPGAVATPQPQRSMLEQFSEFVGGGGNEAVLRIVLWLFDRLVVQGARWLAGVVQDATGTAVTSTPITVQLPMSLTVDAPWVRGAHGVFSRIVDTGLYGVFVGSLVVAAAGGLMGFTTAEAKTVTAVTTLVWFANRRSIDLVTHLVNLSNTAAAQFADVTQMLPGYADMNDLQQGAGDGANFLLVAAFGVVMAFVRWMTVFGVNALVVVMPLALLAAVWPPMKGYFTIWWRTLAGLVFSQVGIALLLGQAQAFGSRFGAGGTGAFLIGSCACLWLATKIPGMLGGLASMPAQIAGNATNTARQYAVAATGSYTGNALAGQAAVSGMGAGQQPATPVGGSVTHASGPTYRSQPLLPSPILSLPRPAPTVIDGRGVIVE